MKLSEAKNKMGMRTARIYLGSLFMDKKREDFSTEEEYNEAAALADPDVYIEIELPKFQELVDLAGNDFTLPEGINLENQNVLNTILDRMEKRGKEGSHAKRIDKLLEIAKNLYITSNIEDEEGNPIKVDDLFAFIKEYPALTLKVVEGMAQAMGKLTAQSKQS
jgi:hypothetical protein